MCVCIDKESTFHCTALPKEGYPLHCSFTRKKEKAVGHAYTFGVHIIAK